MKNLTYIALTDPNHMQGSGAYLHKGILVGKPPSLLGISREQTVISCGRGVGRESLILQFLWGRTFPQTQFL